MRWNLGNLHSKSSIVVEGFVESDNGEYYCTHIGIFHNAEALVCGVLPAQATGLFHETPSNPHRTKAFSTTAVCRQAWIVKNKVKVRDRT